MDLSTLGTETRNERTTDLDRMPTDELLAVMNAEDQSVALAVRDALPQIAPAVEAAVDSLRRGGRLIYVGSGTSGRLGLLDAVECPPTFGTPPEQVVGLLSGGPDAFAVAVEGAEDQPSAAAADLDEIAVNERDIVVGLAASGRTPYVIGALRHAASRGAATVSVACNRDAIISRYADFPIEVLTGPEVLTGSTRLKAGTAQKMVCNMLSTAAMVRLGKVYGNLMVDVKASNEKLVDRIHRMVVEATGADSEAAAEALRKADGHAKTAIVMLSAGTTREDALRRLDEADGDTRLAIHL
ncbi:N-acetylmuramic acid 6-phosphate etherase [Streptomyces recifensis]|uniref:N-acetylmuramic acid 6-phosphate etherase n=1 Tax=Streptomyces recifensis TaxID=67355 RepID=UPI000A388078|nr:N-acetylmuramic acid 6-phosphate etherase [Streptomyces recifensis]